MNEETRQNKRVPSIEPGTPVEPLDPVVAQSPDPASARARRLIAGAALPARRKPSPLVDAPPRPKR